MRLKGIAGVVTAIQLYRISRWLYVRHIPVLPRVLYGLGFFLFNASVPYQAQIGRGTRLGYGGMGVVIHERAVVGRDCIIGQQVTIGGRAGHVNPPRIGNRVYVATGAKVIGDIEIGDESVVGANAVVLHSVPARSVVGGIPARIIKSNIDIAYYMKER